jgi:hypothetical protein
MKKRVVHGSIDLPIREMKFDGYTCWFPHENPDKLARILNDLKENCFAGIS